MKTITTSVITTLITISVINAPTWLVVILVWALCGYIAYKLAILSDAPGPALVFVSILGPLGILVSLFAGFWDIHRIITSKYKFQLPVVKNEKAD